MTYSFLYCGIPNMSKIEIRHIFEHQISEQVYGISPFEYISKSGYGDWLDIDNNVSYELYGIQRGLTELSKIHEYNNPIIFSKEIQELADIAMDKHGIIPIFKFHNSKPFIRSITESGILNENLVDSYTITFKSIYTRQPNLKVELVDSSVDRYGSKYHSQFSDSNIKFGSGDLPITDEILGYTINNGACKAQLTFEHKKIDFEFLRYYTNLVKLSCVTGDNLKIRFVLNSKFYTEYARLFNVCE